MALRPSSVPQCVVLPEPPASSLPHVPDPESDLARAASLIVARLLPTVVNDPDLESTAAFALVTELVDFAARSRLDYVASLVTECESVCPLFVRGEPALSSDVLEDKQFELECLAVALPRFESMVLCPEGDPDALDIPTPRSYAEAIAGTYVNEVPPPGVNIDDGMWIFRVKRLPGSPPTFKACYVARGFTLREYELHSLDFSTAFLQGNLHEEIWLRRPPRFTGSFPAGTQTTLAALGFAPSSADPSLFLHTDTTLPPFYVLVYVDDLVFATADTKALALVLQRFIFQFSLPQPTPLSTGQSLSDPPSNESVEPSGPYPELVGCLMYLMMCTRPELAYLLSLLARYMAPGRHQKVHSDATKRLLRYLCSTSGMGLVLGRQGSVVLTGHSDSSWADDQATQHLSHGYTFSLGSAFVSWRSTRSSSVLGSSFKVEIYAGAMATQQLHWLTYLLTDVGERPCSPPVLQGSGDAAEKRNEPPPSKIEALDGSNYEEWSGRMRSAFKRYKLLKLAMGEEKMPEEGDARDRWIEKSAVLYDLILQSVNNDMFQHIKDLVELDDSAPKTWKLLRDVIQPNTLPMVIVLEKELAALSMRPGNDVKPVLDKIKDTYARMAAAGSNVSQMQQCTKIISVLDNSWDNLIPTLNTQQNQWTPEWLRQQILQEDFRRCHVGGGGANKTAEGYGAAGGSRGRGGGRGRGRGRGFGRGRGRGDYNEGHGSSGGRGSTRMEGACWYCKKAGHPWFKCFGRPEGWAPPGMKPPSGERARGGAVQGSGAQGSGAQGKANPGMFLMVEDVKGSESDVGSVGKVMMHPLTHWVIDSGALLPVIGVENAKVMRANGGLVGLGNVLLVEGLSANLLSVRRLQKSKAEVTFGPTSCRAKLGKLLLWDMEEKNSCIKDLWQLPIIPWNGKPPATAAATAMAKATAGGEESAPSDGALDAVKKVQQPQQPHGEVLAGVDATAAWAKASSRSGEADWETWHERLCHVNFPMLQKLVKDGSLKGLEVKGAVREIRSCPTCLETKLTNFPFSSGTGPAKAPLALVHMDVVGPTRAPSLSGSRYFLTIVDNHTRAVWVYPLKIKGEVAAAVLKEWMPRAQRESGHKVKVIRTDNGGEFFGADFEAVLKKKGIQHQLTVPYNPQQNGVAERFNRTLQEGARTLLGRAGLPDPFWVTALRQVVLVKNRVLATVGDKHILAQQKLPTTLLIIEADEVQQPSRQVQVTVSDEEISGVTEDGGEPEVEEQQQQKDAPPRTQRPQDRPRRDMNPPNRLTYPSFGKPKVVRVGSVAEQCDEDEIAHCYWAAVPEPKTLAEALSGPDAEKWKQSVKEEYDSLLENETWELCELPPGKKGISSKLIFRHKYGPDGELTRYKSRLVAKGFQQTKGKDFDEIFAPVGKGTTLRVMLGTAANRGWRIKQMDITTAFLNGIILEELYMLQPEGLDDGSGRVCSVRVRRLMPAMLACLNFLMLFLA
ncbi:unnamed protein product [Closterium sp. NIES-54]